MCPYNRNDFCLAERPIHDSYLCLQIHLFMLIPQHMQRNSGTERANHEHNQNMHISRSAVYQDNIVTMVPSPTLWFAMRGRAGLSAAEGGIWVHRLTATAAYSAADSRNNKSNSTSLLPDPVSSHLFPFLYMAASSRPSSW